MKPKYMFHSIGALSHLSILIFGSRELCVVVEDEISAGLAAVFIFCIWSVKVIGGNRNTAKLFASGTTVASC